MITIYSEKENTHIQGAIDCLEVDVESSSSQQSYEEIKDEIQSRLQIFDSVKWDAK